MKKTALFVAFYALLWCMGCGKAPAPTENEGTETEETTASGQISSYTLSARGKTEKWNDTLNSGNDITFTFLQVKQNNHNSFTLKLNKTKDNSTIRGVSLDLHTLGNIENKSFAKTYTLVPSHQFAECLDAGCPQKGSGIYAETDNEGNEVMTESGKLEITKYTIEKVENDMVIGKISGSFQFSGRNALQKNPGECSGTFTDAPFKTFTTK